MVRSLFDELRARQGEPLAPPKLKPNIYAKLARFAWRQAAFVVFFWLLVALISSLALWRGFIAPVTATLPLQVSELTASQGATGFAALSSMQTITLSGTKPDLLQDQRNDLVATMRQRDDLYQLIFAPGAGDFYEAHGLLYHPLDEVKGRVAYALSLKPLFIAIAAAPNANSMATLVSGISAAIQQGRDPQGLDDLLAESAQSVQALMRGEDKPVDWSTLANLDNDNTALSVTVLAVPKEGQEAAARSLTLKLLSVVQSSSETTTNLSQPGVPPPKRAPATIDWVRAVAAGAMGVIFLALLLALVLGRLRLVLAAFVPPFLFTFPAALALMMIDGGADWLAFWPLGLGILWFTTALSLHSVFSKVTYAKGRKAREAVVMLADHQHGHEITWLGLLLAVPFAGLMALTHGLGIAALALGLAIAGFAMVLTLPPALLRFIPEALQWRAGEWLIPAHRALFETGQWQWLARGLGAIMVVACLAYLALTPTQTEVRQADVPVSVVAANASEADRVIKRLKSFSEAKAVRWLGMFMPQEAEAKREALHQLSGQFPRITPVQSQPPTDIRDQLETLQDSLKEIAAAEKTQPRLKQAADDFRRSLALLAATSGDEQVRQLENRLFGGFNRLADRADVLSNLTAPQLGAMPGELLALFGKPEGPMRIEVAPATGTSNARMAEILEQAGFDVLHPSVAQDQASRSVNQMVTKVLGAAAGFGLIALLLALRRSRSILAALIMTAAAAITVAAVAQYWQVEWNLTTLLQAISVLSALLGFVWLATAQEGSTATSALELFLLPAMALAVVLPFVALNIAPVVAAVAPTASALFASVIVVGLLRQHRQTSTDDF
jgi:uncharacterized protein